LDRYLDDFYGQLLRETEKEMNELEGDRGKRSGAAQTFRTVADGALALIAEIHQAERVLEGSAPNVIAVASPPTVA
jgi:hypothetical protein